MKQKYWLLQLPMILLAASAFYINELGERGDLHDSFLRNNVFRYLRTVSGAFTNAKFLLRGKQEPKNKIVIVGIDEASLETYGRWPWHRNYIAFMVDQIFARGAKVVGLDIVFSEEDRRVPEELMEILSRRGLAAVAEEMETDPILARTILTHSDRLVLGWATDNACQPRYSNPEECPVADPEWIETHPQGFNKFAYSQVKFPENFQPQNTPIMSLVTFIPNLPQYNAVASHAGTFNIWPDSDGYIRRTPLVILANQTPYPTLALEMARVGLNEDLGIEIGEDQTIERVYFEKSGREISSSPLGSLEINFRGPSYTFPYVSAEEIMAAEQDDVQVVTNRVIASTKEDILKDAYVLIGATALGIYDMRAFPFDENTPGVEGHATILDNLISNDFLVSASSGSGTYWVLIFMILGAGLFAYFTQKLNAIPVMVLFGASLLGIGLIDLKILFANNINWNTSFFYIEMFSIFIFAIAAKYVLEEKQKKFIHGAFGRYISPKMVDTIVKDPSKLSLGGEKKNLTILFSDIRSFTTMSEKMDAKFLARFLNDYLGTMTDIIVNETNGTLDKYIGDAIMAFWGAPMNDPHHAANACRASVLMMKSLRELKGKFQEEYGIDVNIGIGLNTGLVSVGNMGSEKNFNYTVLGDHVNLASRLEGLTKPYGASIVTTRYTFDQIEESGAPIPAHRTLDHVKVKGKKQAVELIQVLDEDLSQEGIETFSEGRNLYSQQNWDAAIRKFESADELLRDANHLGDYPSKMYIERCQNFKSNPPSKDWDGSWEMTSK